MKFWSKILVVIMILSYAAFRAPVFAAETEEYDPQYTMLTLNMAIASIYNVVTTEDRIVLDQEYETIINNLNFGKIKGDPEIIVLHQRLMETITENKLQNEEKARFLETYKLREQNAVISTLSRIRAYGGLVSLATSVGSSYFRYRNSISEYRQELDESLWQLRKTSIRLFDQQQQELLTASWKLSERYGLPDEYRIRQNNLAALYQATHETDAVKAVRMFRALEPDFKVYPPFWYFYGKAASEAKNSELAERCFSEFENVWRPVLSKDPYRVEVAKYRVSELFAKQASNNEIQVQLGIIRENTPREDWNNNLFAGMMYFAIGDQERGIELLHTNVDFDIEREISGFVLQSMEQGELDMNKIAEGLPNLSARADLSYDDMPVDKLNRLAEQGDAKAQFTLGKLYSQGEGVPEDAEQAESWFEKAARQNNTDGQYWLGITLLEQATGEEEVVLKAKLEKTAVEWILKSAEQGNISAQLGLGQLYSVSSSELTPLKELSDSELRRVSMEWYHKAKDQLHHKAAEQRDAEAQKMLGNYYSSGPLEERNLEEAYFWYYLAYLNGDQQAKAMCDDMTSFTKSALAAISSAGVGVTHSVINWFGGDWFAGDTTEQPIKKEEVDRAVQKARQVFLEQEAESEQ